MNRKKSVVKPLCVMIAIQVACLAFGLWLHGHFVLASAQWSAREVVWNELKEGADELQPKTQQQEAGDIPDGQPLPLGMGLIVVDTDWNLLVASSSQEAVVSSAWNTGQTVSQENLAGLKYASSQTLRGTVDTPAGTRQALGWSLPDGSGYAALYREAIVPGPTSAMFSASLPVGAGVAFLWIAGMQSIGLYVVMSRRSKTSLREATVLDEESLRRAQDLVRTRDAVIVGLAKLAEARDTDTGHHLERIGLYCTSLASGLRRHPEYRDLVSPGFVRLIRVSSALHDIGKVGIEDAILLKPARLTEAERAKMQEHALLGGKCIQQIEQQLGTSNFLEMAREIALYHHEHWDGSGYPLGLKEMQIPLAAQIAAIADVYDALAFKRVYKEALPHAECVEIIQAGAGSHFNPELIKVFLETQTQFQEIAQTFSLSRPPVSKESASWIDIQSIKDLEEEVLTVQ